MQQTQMMACPHCGTSNSARRRLCFNCQQELTVAPAAPDEVKKRVLRPRTSAEPVPQRELAPTPQTAAAAEQTPAQRAQTNAERTPAARRTAAPQAPPVSKPATPTASPLLGASLKQRAQMYRQFYSLLKTGVPVGLSLGYLETNSAFTLRPMLREMAQRTQHGELLSDVMRSYPNIFPEWEISMVTAGEKGGTLPEAMQDIAEALELEILMRAEVNGKTLHLKVTTVVFILVALVVGSVQGGVANMAMLFARLAGAFTTFLGIMAVAVGLFIGWRFWGRTREGSQFAFIATSKLPLIGPILKNQMRLRFTRVLAALWHAGVAPIEALETAARATGNPHIIRQVTEKAGDLGKGATLSDVLESTVALPPEALYLLKSGETSGTIVEALSKASEYIQMELESQIRTLPAKAQFLFYAIIVPIIGWFIISFWTKYYSSLLGDGGGMGF